MTMLRLLVFVALSCWSCAASGSEDGLVGALRWYYRWIAELPATAKSMDCTVASFSISQFAFCEPGPLAIDLDMPPSSAPMATNITRALSGFADELRNFKGHRYSGPPQNPVIRALSIQASTLAQCKVDLEQTRRLAATAVVAQQRIDLSNRGIALRFPLVCEGDPFCLVFFYEGQRR